MTNSFLYFPNNVTVHFWILKCFWNHTGGDKLYLQKSIKYIFKISSRTKFLKKLVLNCYWPIFLIPMFFFPSYATELLMLVQRMSFVKYINVADFVGISIILTTCFSFYMKNFFFNDLCLYFCILLFELVLICQTTWGSLHTTTFKFESLVFCKMGSYSSYWEIFSIFTIFEKRLFKTSVVFILVFTSSQFSVKFILLLLYDALENKDFTTL